MAWRTVDAKDLAATLSQTEIDAFRRSVPAGGGDPVARLLSRTAAMVRGYVASNGKVAMGPAGTLPESLVSPAMDYAAADVLKRMDTPMNEDRRRARENHGQRFREFGQCKPPPRAVGRGRERIGAVFAAARLRLRGGQADGSGSLLLLIDPRCHRLRAFRSAMRVFVFRFT